MDNQYIPEKFIWEKSGSSKMFPIDWTRQELAKKLYCSERHVGNKLLRHPLLYDTLLRLWSDDPSKVLLDKDMQPPIPLELYPLLECMQQMEERPGYRQMWDNPTPSAIQKYLIELYRMLYDNVVIDKGSASDDEKTVCRRALFETPSFNQMVLDKVWEEELFPRIERLRNLATDSPFELQASILADCMLSLDRCMIMLQESVNSDDQREDNSPNMEEEFKRMIRSICAYRKPIRGANGWNRFELKNIMVDAEHTMGEAFEILARTPQKCSELLDCTREQYLSDMVASGKTADFETEFSKLQAYLSITAMPTSEELGQIITERCKQHCEAIINYCRGIPNIAPLPPMKDASQFYIADMIDHLAYSYMNKEFAKHNEFFQKTMVHYVAFMQIMEDLYPVVEVLSRDPSIRIVVKKEDNLTYQKATEFFALYLSEWNALYGYDATFADASTYRFIDTDLMWRRGCDAALFFNKSNLYFDGVRASFNQCIESLQQILENHDIPYSPHLVPTIAGSLSMGLVLQILQDIVKKASALILHSLCETFS